MSLFFPHFAKVSSHVWRDCPVSHTLCCYTTIIVTIIEAVPCFPSQAWAHRALQCIVMLHSHCWHQALSGFTVCRLNKYIRDTDYLQCSTANGCTVPQWAGCLSCKSQVSTHHTRTGACSLCPTAKSKDDFKELNILVLFTTWTTPFTHFWVLLAKMPL